MSAEISAVVYFSAIVLCVPFLIGVTALFLFGRKRALNGPVGLLFHALSEKSEPHCSYFSPEKFRNLLFELKKLPIVCRTINSPNIQPSGSEGDHRPVFLTFDDGFESFYTYALSILDEFGFKATVFPVAGFLGKRSSWDALPQQAHLSSGQIQEISRLGHEIGSHTYSHANLTLLSDNDVMTELVRSKQVLEDITGKAVTSLSFPFGRWNGRIWQKALEAGYARATADVHHASDNPAIVKIYGVYSYDSVHDVLERVFMGPLFSFSTARGRLMPHFAKGSPLWKFRKNYALHR